MDIYNVELVDGVLQFTWKNLDFDVQVIDGEIQWWSLECLENEIVQVDFPKGHSVRKYLEGFVSDSKT